MYERIFLAVAAVVAAVIAAGGGLIQQLVGGLVLLGCAGLAVWREGRISAGERAQYDRELASMSRAISSLRADIDLASKKASEEQSAIKNEVVKQLTHINSRVASVERLNGGAF